MTTTKKSSQPAQKSTNKKTAVKKISGENQNTVIVSVTPLMDGAVPMDIPLNKVDINPDNYRKYYSVQDLNDFAEVLKIQGVISPITVRLKDNGRYELVVGERRYKASIIAGLEIIPARVKTLPDDIVREIMLSENMQRENPHPMNEAQAIGDMQVVYKTVPEVAARLGKSKQFVYSRIRLLELIEPIREMFVENVFNIQEAFEIAGISQESQQDFFDRHCANWKEQEKFNTGGLRHTLSNYKCDLTKAPFDREQNDLLPEAGACTACPSNSATLSSLFPDLAKQSTCSNKQCFQRKCGAHFSLLLTDTYLDFKPHAFIFRWQPTEAIQEAINLLPGADELPQLFTNGINEVKMPAEPDKEEYFFNDEEDEEAELVQ